MKTTFLKLSALTVFLLLFTSAKAQNVDFTWNNTSSCGISQVEVYDASNVQLWTGGPATCCGPILCLTGVPSYFKISVGACNYTVPVNQSTTSYTNCSCNVNITTSYGGTGFFCGFGSVLTLSITP